MTHQQAEKVADVLIAVGLAGAAIYAMSNPVLRRRLLGVARTTLFGAAPGWLAAEARRGWEESARAPETTAL